MRLSKAAARALLPRVYQALALYKSDAGTQRAFALLAKVRDRHDLAFAEVFQDWLGDVRDALGAIDAEDRADFIAAIREAFDVEPLLSSYKGALDSFLADYQKTFDREVRIATDWEKANTSAVDTLSDSVGKFFGDFATGQQDRILGILEQGIADGDATPKMAARLASGMDNIEYRNEDGEVFRTLSPDVWATNVARTETNRAYAEATKGALTEAGLKTWQWICADDERTCDECQGNDGQIVNIGDDFDSGDAQPPIHGGDRCIVTAVEAELTGDSTDNANSDGGEE